MSSEIKYLQEIIEVLQEQIGSGKLSEEAEKKAKQDLLVSQHELDVERRRNWDGVCRLAEHLHFQHYAYARRWEDEDEECQQRWRIRATTALEVYLGEQEPEGR